MPCVSLQRMPYKFQEESSDLETHLLELVVGFICQLLKIFFTGFFVYITKGHL